MSDDVTVLHVTRKHGTVEQEQVLHDATELILEDRQLVAVSDNVAQLTRVTELSLSYNSFATIAAGALFMTQLTRLSVGNNLLTTIPREIGRLTALKELWLNHNRLTRLPREIGLLEALEFLWLSNNALASVPAELGLLSSLKELLLQSNRLKWPPLALGRLPATTEIRLGGNPLPFDVGLGDSRSKLPDLFAVTSHLISVIRDSATDALIGLADLDLPALLSVEIVDELFPNSIPMHKKWDLVVAVKHWHQRHGTER